MITFFNNLKPFIAYWGSLAIYIIISLFEALSSKDLVIVFFVAYIISGLLIGCTTTIKKMYLGIILFELQLIICAIVFSINTVSSGLNTFASAGNVFYSTFFENINSVFSFILSLLLPLVLFGIGFGFIELKNKRKSNFN